jgi:hypothetical protein
MGGHSKIEGPLITVDTAAAQALTGGQPEPSTGRPEPVPLDAAPKGPTIP